MILLHAIHGILDISIETKRFWKVNTDAITTQSHWNSRDMRSGSVVVTPFLQLLEDVRQWIADPKICDPFDRMLIAQAIEENHTRRCGQVYCAI